LHPETGGWKLSPVGWRCAAIARWSAAGAVLLAAAANAEPLPRVTFLPQWLPQAQFAGYYVAQDKGFYRARGLDVDVLSGGPDSPTSTGLEQGSADFGTLWLSTAIQLRARGMPVVNLAQIVERSSLMLVARRARGIQSPADLNGHKIGVWEGDFLLQPQLFFKRQALDVYPVPIASTINLFLRGGTDVNVAMWYNEYHTILSAGLDPDELTTFFFYDYGLDFPEDGIYCREETLRERPAQVAAFVQGSLDGWEYAFAHPGEAVDVVMQYMRRAHVPTSRVHQEWMLARMRDLILPAGAVRPSGILTRASYDRVADALVESGWISAAPPFDSFAHAPK